jgi:hypothetical protein
MMMKALRPAVSEPLTVTHQFLVFQGFVYTAIGVMLFAVPCFVSETVLFVSEPVGRKNEPATRLFGVAFVVIGYFYVQIARSNSEQAVFFCIVGRVNVPIACAVLAAISVCWQLCALFGVLDAAGAVLTHFSWRKTHSAQEPPPESAPLTFTHRFLIVQGFVYMAVGFMCYALPRFVTETLLFESEPVAARDEDMTRMIGLAVFVIGSLYTAAGMLNSEHAVAACIFDRVLVPIPCAIAAWVGSSWQFCLFFAVADPTLAMLTYCSWRKDNMQVAEYTQIGDT